MAPKVQIFGNVTFNGSALIVGGVPAKVTALEIAFFATLAANAGKTLSDSDILAAVYGNKKAPFYSPVLPEADIVKVIICKLRAKLAKAAKLANSGAANPINTVWGLGYNLATPARKAA